MSLKRLESLAKENTVRSSDACTSTHFNTARMRCAMPSEEGRVAVATTNPRGRVEYHAVRVSCLGDTTNVRAADDAATCTVSLTSKPPVAKTTTAHVPNTPWTKPDTVIFLSPHQSPPSFPFPPYPPPTAAAILLRRHYHRPARRACLSGCRVSSSSPRRATE